MCGCEFILELSDAMQKLSMKALVIDIRHHWRSRRNENSSRIFFGFVPCVCDFEMTVNSVRVTTHILCVLLFFGTCRALLCPTRLSLFLSWRNLSSSYSIFLLFALAFFFLFLCFLCLMLSLIPTLWLESSVKSENLEGASEKCILFHFLAALWCDFLRFFFCYFVYVYSTHFSCRLMLPFIVNIEFYSDIRMKGFKLDNFRMNCITIL